MGAGSVNLDRQNEAKGTNLEPKAQQSAEEGTPSQENQDCIVFGLYSKNMTQFTSTVAGVPCYVLYSVQSKELLFS